MTETGIPIIPALADVMKVEPSDVRGLIEEGKGGVNQYLTAMKSLTEGSGSSPGSPSGGPQP